MPCKEKQRGDQRRRPETHAAIQGVLQPRELYRSQQYATAIYRSELAVRLKGMGYQIEQSANGAPEIKGYSQEYLEASSPRRQQIKEHLESEGINSAEAAQIAAHRTRGAKLTWTVKPPSRTCTSRPMR